MRKLILSLILAPLLATSSQARVDINRDERPFSERYTSFVDKLAPGVPIARGAFDYIGEACEPKGNIIQKRQARENEKFILSNDMCDIFMSNIQGKKRSQFGKITDSFFQPQASQTQNKKNKREEIQADMLMKRYQKLTHDSNILDQVLQAPVASKKAHVAPSNALAELIFVEGLAQSAAQLNSETQNTLMDIEEAQFAIDQPALTSIIVRQNAKLETFFTNNIGQKNITLRSKNGFVGNKVGFWEQMALKNK
jgi:hypothetical protein